MSDLSDLESILGFMPETTGELNRHATHSTPVQKNASKITNHSSEIRVNEDYKKVKRLIDTDYHLIFVTGKAGTGKSTLIKYLRETISRKKQLAVLAPTGVAALHVEGVTIHSFFRFPARVLNENEIKEVEDRKIYKKLDVLILDEISMVRADLIDSIDRFLRINGKSCDKVFGGTQVIMIGDLFQLPPVVSEEEEATLFSRKYTSPYFFSAKALEEEIIAPVELTEVFRQQDDQFISILNRIRLGDCNDDVLNFINSRAISPPPDCEATVLTPTNTLADSINIQKMQALSDNSCQYMGSIDETYPKT